MPAAAFFPLFFYGAGSLSGLSISSASAVAGLSGEAPMGAVGVSLASSPRAFLISARQMAAAGVTIASGAANLRGAAKLRGIDTIGVLSQDDVAGAVLEAVIEPGITLRDSVQLMLAVMTGRTALVPGAGGSTTVTFRDPANTTNRVTATMVGRERTNVVLDAD